MGFLPRCTTTIGSQSEDTTPQRGGVLVELSIFLPFFILLLSGVIDLALNINEHAVLVEASRYAARYAAGQRGEQPSAIYTSAVEAAKKYLREHLNNPTPENSFDISVRRRTICTPNCGVASKEAIEVAIARRSGSGISFLKSGFGVKSCGASVFIGEKAVSLRDPGGGTPVDHVSENTTGCHFSPLLGAL